MSIESALQKLQKALDDGQAEKAGALLVASASEFAKDPRALLPVLDGLDRQRKDEALNTIVAKVQELNILPLESAIFEMRLKFRATRYGEALRIIDKVLTLSNDSIEALRTGGRIGNLTKDEPLALRYWERLARTSASDPEAALQAARIYLRRQQYTQALNWAQVAAERRPDSLEPVQIAVSSGLEVGWPEGCDGFLASLFKLDRTQALKPLARLAQELECERAAKVLSALQQQSPGDQAIADIAAKVYSEWLVAALEQELASRELEAAAFYRAARTVQPANSNPQRALERLCSPSLLAMRDAFNSRDFAGAVEHGEMAARINPECFEAWQTVGRAQFTRGNIAEAGEAFRHCTELDTKDAHSWLTYGLVLNQGGDRRGALRAFQTARGLADADVKREAEASIAALHPLLVREAKQAAAEGNIEVAWQASESALLIRRDDGGIADLRRNLLRQQQNQIRDAWNAASESVIPLCRSYLEKAPGDPYASTVLGRMLMRSRAYAEALPLWEGICKQSPQDAHGFLQVARCCRALRTKDRGLAAAETALRLDRSLQEAADLVAFFKGQIPQPAPATGDAKVRRQPAAG
jgi:tetratricopeptide (TPR) repeat protein